MTRLGFLFGALVCLSPQAQASEPTPPPSNYGLYSVPYNWSGPYAGAFVGGVHSIWTVDFYRNNNHGHSEQSSDGFAGGGFAGYNWQVSPNWVIGVEGDLGWTNASQHNEIFDNDHTDSEIGAFGSLRFRAGYAVDRILFFATAGVAWANIDQNIQKGRNAGEQVVYENETSTGYVIGAGIEYAFADGWVSRAEYLYSNYGTVNLTNRDGNQAVFENDLSLIRVGLSRRF
jgi:outer membrane immunogenic protein